jgi:phosphatidylserine/phosphatidylglycerophosphate/cardiolipin synthase-like enzyme
MQIRAFTLVALLLFSTASMLVDTTEATTSGRAMACNGTVCLNEALPNPNGLDNDTWPNGEWMEIYNSGTTPVDVLNWELVNKASKSLTFDSASIVGFQAGNSNTWTIQPGDYMVIARNGNSNFYLTNSGDWITMKDSSGNTVDQASWNSTASGVSLEEDSTNAVNDWVSTNNPTPGSANSASTGPVASDLVMNEVMPNPWPSDDNASWPGGEWVEILNTGTSDLNLTGWSIVDNAGNTLPFNASHLVGPSSIIAAGEHRIIAVNSSTSWGVLNNGGESLRLLWPNGTLSQTISWTNTEPGFSLTEQQGGTWGHSSFPTPGSENPPYWEAIVNGTSPVRITEVLVNSSMDGSTYPDGEWLELHNRDNSAIDLTGWKIKDGMGNITYLDMSTLVNNATQLGTMIDADGRRLVQFFMGTELWNNYNHVMLLDQNDIIVHKAWWTSNPGLNITLVESEDPVGEWIPASWPTPGQPEPSTTPITGEVAFNEILPDAVGNDTDDWPGGEWIELINIGNQTVDLANWHFTSGSRNFNINVHQLVTKDNTLVMPGEIALVAINGSQGFYLRNAAGDTIELRDSSNQIISTITYNSSTEGESNWFWNGDWSQAPWATPGAPNPTTSPYTGELSIEVTEVLAHCSAGTIIPGDDWIEVLNNGTQPIDLSAWRMIASDGELMHMRPSWQWNETTMIIQSGDRMVFNVPNWFISGLGDNITLEDPDGNIVDYVEWDITTDCKTMDRNGQMLPWPTPGEEEPDISDFAGADDLRFSRFMFEEKSTTTNDEFFEISNTGDIMAVLNGWTVRKTTTGGVSFNGTFTGGEISAGSSVIISPDANSVKAMGATMILDADDVMNFPVWLPNSGATIQLIAPDGTIADTFVYGNGPTDAEGWSGPSIAEPVTTVDRILYLRGDGCGEMPDTNSANDWEMRWSVAGASHFCGINTFTDDTDVTPLIGPDAGLDEVISMINSATDSIHLHVYQLHDAYLSMALIEASNRGVDITVVIHEPETWWGDYNIGQSLGIAWELENAGITVMQFTTSSSSPYQYIHSKIAVVDSTHVWISSGNWKSSSLPSDGVGNRDWGVIVNSTDLATIVMERMAFDEDPSQLHVEDSTYSMPDSGSYTPPVSYTPGDVVSPVTGPVSGELLTCPDDCMQGLADFINSAESEILLSLQYFEMDWYWGWGENPLLDSLENAAERGVSIRLVINQHYVNENPGIRQAVNELNDWEGDVEAILMSENETVTKLHNKGVIIDGESVLVSSINWGDNSILRNREMGLILHSQQVTQPYMDSFWEDWNRLDDTTDTDIDGIPDFWEVANGLSRTNQDSAIDSDGDGLSNLGEYSYGSDPNSNDTDGDCIADGDEILWAATQSDVSASDALNLADADGDGTDDNTVIGCEPDLTTEPVDNQAENNADNNTGNNSTVGDLDSDNDGILDDVDECPDTEEGAATDTQGCSNEQNKNQVFKDTEEDGLSSGMKFMWTLITIGIIVLVGAGTLLLKKKKEEDLDEELSQIVETTDAKSWDMPVLDGTSEAEDLGFDLSRFPGWSAEQVQKYLDSGWTEDQLAEWYQQQLKENTA